MYYLVLTDNSIKGGIPVLTGPLQKASDVETFKAMMNYTNPDVHVEVWSMVRIPSPIRAMFSFTPEGDDDL